MHRIAFEETERVRRNERKMRHDRRRTSWWRRWRNTVAATTMMAWMALWLMALEVQQDKWMPRQLQQNAQLGRFIQLSHPQMVPSKGGSVAISTQVQHQVKRRQHGQQRGPSQGQQQDKLGPTLRQVSRAASSDTNPTKDAAAPVGTPRTHPSSYISHKTMPHDDGTNDETDKVCRIVLENGVDFHYELIESTVMRFPLPWETLGCATSSIDPISGAMTLQPVVFDVVHVDQGGLFGEMEGWRRYYNRMLRDTVRNRTDGVLAQFGTALPLSRYAFTRTKYHATIGISINAIAAYLGDDATRFSIGHTRCNAVPVATAAAAADGERASLCGSKRMQERVVGLNPMHDRYFLPIDLPQFGTWSRCIAGSSISHNSNSSNNTNSSVVSATSLSAAHDERKQSENRRARMTPPLVTVCTVGGSKQHGMLAQALRQLQPENLIVKIHQRDEQAPKAYVRHGVRKFVRIVNEPKFWDFQRSISQCDVLLPLVDPSKNPGYFLPQAKMSGAISQILAYNLPTVMHTQLFDIYGKFVSAPVEQYIDVASFTASVDKLVHDLRDHWMSQDCKRNKAS